MTRFGSELIVLMLASIALWTTAGVAEGPSGPAIRVADVARQREPMRLEPGQPVSQAIAAGETHSYRVALRANQILHVIATQLGADIVVTLVGSDGKPMVEMDSPTGASARQTSRVGNSLRFVGARSAPT